MTATRTAPLLSKAIESYLRALKSEGRSAYTLSGYRYALDNFLLFTGNMPVSELDEDHVRGFVEYEKTRPSNRINAKETTTLKEYSVHKRYSVVRAFSRWLFFQRFIELDFSSMTRPPKIANVMPEALTDEEIRAVINANIVKGSYRNQVIVKLFLGTGLRLAEVANLKVEDVDLEESTLKVFGKGKKYALVPISPRLRRELHKYIYQHREPKFESEKALFLNHEGTAFTRDGIQIMIRRVLKEAGVTHKAGPHILRHTFATNFLRDGGNLEALRMILRHTDIKTTQRYTHLRITDLQAQIERADPLERVNGRRR